MQTEAGPELLTLEEIQAENHVKFHGSPETIKLFYRKRAIMKAVEKVFTLQSHTAINGLERVLGIEQEATDGY